MEFGFDDAISEGDALGFSEGDAFGLLLLSSAADLWSPSASSGGSAGEVGSSMTSAGLRRKSGEAAPPTRCNARKKHNGEKAFFRVQLGGAVLQYDGRCARGDGKESSFVAAAKVAPVVLAT